MAKENRGMSHCETILQKIIAGMRMIALEVREVVYMWILEVRCVRFNMSVLNPECDFFWQRPKSMETKTEKLWFHKAAVGKKTHLVIK
jgi:hypothetical protein